MGRSHLIVSIALASILAGHPTPGFAQQHLPLDIQAQAEPVESDDPWLRRSIGRLHARSAAWREALDRVGKTGKRAYVLTPNRVRMIDAREGIARPFDRSLLAETLPISDRDLRVEVVVVVVNVPLLQELHSSRLPHVDFERDLDRILAHEVYAHAIPYLLAGHMSGRCADPLPGQAAADSCAIRRENEIRAELGLGTRTESGLESLSLIRSIWGEASARRSVVHDVTEHLPRSVFLDHRSADFDREPRP